MYKVIFLDGTFIAFAATSARNAVTHAQKMAWDYISIVPA